MNGPAGQKSQDFVSTWVNNRGIVGYGVPLSQLAPEQIAIYAADNFNKSGEPVSLKLNEINFNKHSRLVLRQGLHSTKGSRNPFFAGTDGIERKSFDFTKDRIVGFRGFKATTGGQTGDIVVLGYDGLDASKDLGKAVRLDSKPLRVNFRFSGGPIQMFFNRNYIDYSMDLDKGLCVGDCDCYDSCGKVNSDFIADSIIKRFETETVYAKGYKTALHKLPLSKLARATKIRKCAEGVTVPALATTKYKKFSISIPKGIYGVEASIGKALQDAAVATVSQLENSGVEGQNNIYSVWTTEATSSLPDVTFTDYVLPVCDTCPTCPVETTAVEGVKNVQVRVQSGAELPVIEVEEGEDAIELSTVLVASDFDLGDTYMVTYPASTPDEDIEEIFEGLPFTITGVNGKHCLVGSSTFEWASCEEAFTTTKEYEIVLPGKECDTTDVSDRLAELQAAFPDLVITTKQVGSCITSYKTTIESDRLPAEKCDREFGTFHFKTPGSYDGHLWVPATPVSEYPVCTPAPVVEQPCCVAGVVFETARWADDYQDCNFGYTSFDINYTRPVRLEVNIHDLDITESSCGNVTSHYSTVLQRASYEKGTHGLLILDKEKLQLSYENPQGYSTSHTFNDARGFHAVTDPTKLYDVYTLDMIRRADGESWGTEGQEIQSFEFAVQAGQGKALEEMLNTLVLNANPKLKAVTL